MDAEKDAEPVVETQPVVEKAQPTALELQTAEITRLQEETKSFYSGIGEIAEKQYGMSQKEAISLIMGLTTEELAQIAYVKKGVTAGKTANELIPSKKPQAPSSIAGMSPATPVVNNVEQEYVPQRNPFTF